MVAPDGSADLPEAEVQRGDSGGHADPPEREERLQDAIAFSSSPCGGSGVESDRPLLPAVLLLRRLGPPDLPQQHLLGQLIGRWFEPNRRSH